MPASSKTVIVIAGPTAVGKTEIAIQVARRLGTEIISADSRQCYRELNIGVARPSAGELAAVPHHFIASHSIHDTVTAATFEEYALEQAERIFQHRDTLVLAGGTGLYIKAFCEGLDEIPEVPEAIRSEVVQGFERYGRSWLQEQVQQADPEFYSRGETENPRRLMRALEVVRATGRSIFYFRSGQPAERPFRVQKIGLQLPREELHRRIHVRVDGMMAAGLLEEVRTLLPFQHLNALQTVGYRELFDYFGGKRSLEDAVGAIRTHTRQYAKRQMTWFRKDGTYQWFDPRDGEAILQHLPVQE